MGLVVVPLVLASPLLHLALPRDELLDDVPEHRALEQMGAVPEQGRPLPIELRLDLLEQCLEGVLGGFAEGLALDVRLLDGLVDLSLELFRGHAAMVLGRLLHDDDPHVALRRGRQLGAAELARDVLLRQEDQNRVRRPHRRLEVLLGDSIRQLLVVEPELDAPGLGYHQPQHRHERMHLVLTARPVVREEDVGALGRKGCLQVNGAGGLPPVDASAIDPKRRV